MMSLRYVPLPSLPLYRISDADSQDFPAAGMSFYLLEPMSRGEESRGIELISS
jgi:hypothetical protein